MIHLQCIEREEEGEKEAYCDFSSFFWSEVLYVGIEPAAAAVNYACGEQKEGQISDREKNRKSFRK